MFGAFLRKGATVLATTGAAGGTALFLSNPLKARALSTSESSPGDGGDGDGAGRDSGDVNASIAVAAHDVASADLQGDSESAASSAEDGSPPASAEAGAGPGLFPNDADPNPGPNVFEALDRAADAVAGAEGAGPTAVADDGSDGPKTCPFKQGEMPAPGPEHHTERGELVVCADTFTADEAAALLAEQAGSFTEEIASLREELSRARAEVSAVARDCSARVAAAERAAAAASAQAERDAAAALDTQHRALENQHAREVSRVMAGVAAEFGAERLERCAAVDSLSARVATLAADMEARAVRDADCEKARLLSLACHGIGDALEARVPFEAELELLERVANRVADPLPVAAVGMIPAAIAADGAASHADLVEAFVHCSKDARRVTLTAPDAGFFGHVAGTIASKLWIEEPATGLARTRNDPAAVLVFAREKLDNGDVSGALHLIDRKLPEREKKAMGPWLEKARGRAAVKQAIDAIQAHCAATLSGY